MTTREPPPLISHRVLGVSGASLAIIAALTNAFENDPAAQRIADELATTSPTEGLIQTVSLGEITAGSIMVTGGIFDGRAEAGFVEVDEAGQMQPL